MDCIESVYAFGSMDILTILILPVHEHEITFHLFPFFMSSSISTLMSSSFQHTGLSPPWLNFF